METAEIVEIIKQELDIEVNLDSDGDLEIEIIVAGHRISSRYIYLGEHIKRIVREELEKL